VRTFPRCSEVLVLNAWRSFGLGGTSETKSEDEAIELVDQATRDLKDSGISARGEVHPGLYGFAAEEVLAMAESEDADMIVMGSRGLSDLKGLLVRAGWARHPIPPMQKAWAVLPMQTGGPRRRRRALM